MLAQSSATFKDAALVVMVTVLCLVPFAGKAFHNDDVPYLWCARQIQESPGDFYGFFANWSGHAVPMYTINYNPPLVPYYIAVAAWLFGWSEIMLHIVFLAPAASLAVGMYYLSRYFCSRPLIATLLGILSPVFLVSSTSVMLDIPMLALYVWAIVLWLRGIENDRLLHLFLAAILISLSALAKYYGITAVLLLAAYSILRKKKLGMWTVILGIPVVILIGYEVLCHQLYGIGLLENTASFTMEHSGSGVSLLVHKPLVGLSFTGGCLLSVIFYSHLIWDRRTIVLGCLIAVFVSLLLGIKAIGGLLMLDKQSMSWHLSIQCAVYIIVGIEVLCLVVLDLWKQKNALSFLLFLWVLGTFIFSGFVNWTTNARTILPMVPAVGILVARRLDKMLGACHQKKGLSNISPLIPAAIIAMLVVWADTTYANCQRSAARLIHNQYGRYAKRMWFEGHSGFQYYMELHGAVALDYVNSTIEQGDIVAIPLFNTCLRKLPMANFNVLQELQLSPFRWLATMSPNLGAGYGGDTIGPMPFSFGRVPPEKYLVLIATESTPPLAHNVANEQ